MYYIMHLCILSCHICTGNSMRLYSVSRIAPKRILYNYVYVNIYFLQYRQIMLFIYIGV